MSFPTPWFGTTCVTALSALLALLSGCSAGESDPIRPSLDSGTTLDGTPDAASEPQPDGSTASPDGGNDSAIDEASEAASETRAPDGANEGVPAPDSLAPDGAACSCQAEVSLNCFFDSSGPFSMGARPTTDVGFAEQLCAGNFPPTHCIDNVEVFSYDDCGRTMVRVSGCYSYRQYIFDRTSHELVGAGAATDTAVACNDGGWVTSSVTAGERLSSSCTQSRCSLVCRLVRGRDMPICVQPDGGEGGADVDTSIDGQVNDATAPDGAVDVESDGS